MNPGKLNKKIQIVEYKEVPDGGGGYETVISPVKNVWANVRPLSGRELWQAQQTQAEISHKITIRFIKDLDKSYIILYQNRKFDIQYLIDIEEKNRFLEIQVLERQ